MTPQDKAFRDQVAITVMSICMSDFSRQVSSGSMPMQDVPKAIETISRIAYDTAAAMLKARAARSRK